MANARRLSFGIKTAQHHTTYEDVLRVWREADGIPIIEHAWLFDHFLPQDGDPAGPCLEGWTLLAALAARTERLRVGILVTGNTYRHPAVLAKMAAAVDRVSHGRLDFGIGAGWNEAEHAMYGIRLPPPGERIRRLDETCELIRRLWTEPIVTFDGRYYHLKEARCEPRPVQRPHPPIVIGGGGERLTLAVVARHADIWNIIPRSVEEFAHKTKVLDEHCQRLSRDPADIVRSVQVLAGHGDLEATRLLLARYVTMGATHLVLEVAPPYPEGIVRHLTDEICALLQSTSSVIPRDSSSL